MTINEILAQYGEKRTAAELLAERRKKDAIENDPRLKELTAKKRELQLARIRDAADLKSSEETKAEIEKIKAEIRAVCPDDFAPAYECSLCGDTGYVSLKNGREMCSCLLNKIYTEVYAARNPKTGIGFECFKTDVYGSDDGNRRAANMLKFFKKYVAEYPAKKGSVLITGAAGTGKTLMLNCFAHALSEKCDKILYIGAQELNAVFHKSRLGADIPLDYINSADVLMIDDLGSEPMTANVTKEYLFGVLDSRIHAGLPTIAATNLSAQQLKERYGERISSRLCSSANGRVLNIVGTDMRLKQI